MIFSPKISKFQTSHIRNNQSSIVKKQILVTFGDVCLVLSDNAYLCGKHADFIRIFLKRNLKKRAKFFFKLNPNVAITKKPNETRMGKGKGNISHWVVNLKAGQQIVGIESNRSSFSKTVIKSLIKKLSVKSFCSIKKLRWIL